MDPQPRSAQDYLDAAEAAARLERARMLLEATTPPPEPEPVPVPILDPGPPQPVDPDVVIQWQGEWTWERGYTRGQLVSFRGSSYLALEDNELREPDESPGVWALVAKRGRQGERGPLGPAGERGPRGNTGSPGSSGPQGIQGVKGDPGDSGSGGSTFVVPAIALGTAAVEGVANSVIRSDATLLAFDATSPTTSAVGDAAATGSVAVAARRDHAHGREGFGSPAASAVTDAGTDGAASTVAHSDHKHAREGFGSPSTQAFGDAPTDGVSATVPHADHKHGMPANPVPAFGSPGTSAVGDSSADGVATTLPRSDHKHGREAFGSPAASAVGDAGADGAATTVARANHVHAREAFAAPATSAVTDAGTTGVATTLVHSDHKHAREGFGLPAASAVGDAQATGTAATVPHSDHVHARESFGAASGLLLKSTAASGSGASPLRADASIKAFDTTDPSTQAFGDAAVVGTIDFAARRDHKHAMPLVTLAALPIIPDVLAVAAGAQSIPTGVETPLLFGATDVDDSDNQHYSSDANLTGTVQKTAASAAVVGTSTLFTSELSVGQIILIPGTANEKRVVTVITDNTHLTVSANFTNSASGQTAQAVSSGVTIRTAGVYHCEGNALFQANATGNVRAFELYMQRGANRTLLAASQMPPVPATYGVGVTVGKRQRFLQWDFVEYVLFQDATGGAALNTGTIPQSSLAVTWVRA